MRTILPRSIRSWIVLAIRALTAGCWVAALVLRGDARIALVSVAAGGLLVAVVFRQKAPPAQGALWSASADLRRGRSRFAGQLSLLADAIVWTPSTYSRRRGFDQAVRFAADEWTGIDVEAGPGLLDVLISVRGADDQSTCFTTHRTRGLREAIGQLRAPDHHQ